MCTQCDPPLSVRIGESQIAKIPIQLYYYCLRGGVTLKKMESLGQSPKRGGEGSDPNPIFFLQNFLFLETTNFVSLYLKTCMTVKIGLNLMHTNLISRLIHLTVPVSWRWGNGWYWVKKKMFTKHFLDCDF